MRIGELARAANVSASAVRYYESIGLLPAPARTAAGYRDYGDDALAQVRFIRDAQAAGLSLADTAELVQMKASGEATCEHTVALLDRRLDSIADQIATLEAARVELQALRTRAADLDPAACQDPNRCQVLALDLEVELKV